MSRALSFGELVNLAIGTPAVGSVNFNALHLLLRSLLEHLGLQDVRREVSGEELGLLGAQEPAAALQLPGARAPSSIFHQLQARLAALEGQLRFLDGAPGTAELLERSQPALQPAQDMWQLMRLKKKVELNEEGMDKAMKTLQDLLSNIYTLRAATDNFQGEIGHLKDNFSQLDVSEVMERLSRLDEKVRMLEELRESLGDLRAPALDPADFVPWSTFCESLTGKSYPEAEREAREASSREALAQLSELPEKHEVIAAQVAQLEQQLEQQLKQQEEQRAVAERLLDSKSLLERVDWLQLQHEKGKESLEGAMGQLQKLKAQYEKLQRAMDTLVQNTSDIQSMRDMLEQLDIAKADKALIQEEMKVKADKSALEAKVNHGELQVATSQLSEMMRDLLQRMSLQDKDWQKALEKLFVDMDCKLDRMALDPLSQQLEEVWRFIKKFLSEGPRFDADSAAGFKKQLFERVKCISCDRPVTMMTGPHMITVRKAPLGPRPASANGYEYLSRKQRRDPEMSDAGLPTQTCWQCQAHHQACTIKRAARSQELATIYPYGDPAALPYDCAEVDILGVNGVLYKGRVNAQAAERVLALQREFTAVPKLPRPPSAARMERARSAFADASASPYTSPSLRRISSAAAAAAAAGRQHFSLETVDGTLAPSFSQGHFRNDGGLAGT